MAALEVVFLFCAFAVIWASSRMRGGPDPKHPQLRNYKIAGMTDSDSHVKRILAFGDSITEGYIDGGQRFHPYTTELERLLNVNSFNHTRFQVINEGISGECAFVEMNTRLPVVLDSYKFGFDLVIILGGTNDFRKLDCSRDVNVAYEVISMHRIVHKEGIKTVMVTIPEHDDSKLEISKKHSKKLNDIRKTVNSKLRNYAARYVNGTLLCDLDRYFPLHTLNRSAREKLWDDTVHPSDFGYNRISKLMFRAIRREFNI